MAEQSRQRQKDHRSLQWLNLLVEETLQADFQRSLKGRPECGSVAESKILQDLVSGKRATRVHLEGLRKRK